MNSVRVGVLGGGGRIREGPGPRKLNLREESQIQVRAGSCWLSHEGRPATARVGLTAPPRGCWPLWKLLLGKGHFFSLLLGKWS